MWWNIAKLDSSTTFSSSRSLVWWFLTTLISCDMGISPSARHYNRDPLWPLPLGKHLFLVCEQAHLLLASCLGLLVGFSHLAPDPCTGTTCVNLRTSVCSAISGPSHFLLHHYLYGLLSWQWELTVLHLLKILLLFYCWCSCWAFAANWHSLAMCSDLLHLWHWIFLCYGFLSPLSLSPFYSFLPGWSC